VSMFDKLKEVADQYKVLEQKISDPEFIANQVAYQKALKEMGGLSKLVDAYSEYEEIILRIAEADEIIEAREDSELVEMARDEAEALKEQADLVVPKLQRLLVQDDTHSGKKVIIEIRAGTGGDEASLFSGDLFRMYQRFAERSHFRMEVLDSSSSEVGGFKEVIISVSGKRAWDMLRFESGGHRVQRVPVTESQGRIHTSAATVAVLPEAKEVDVDVKESDLKIERCRAGGPGGQNVNKVETAIRIIHQPTGLVVQCQDESSQHKNKAKAMRILNARLYDLEQTRLNSERSAERRDQIGSGDRNMRIRTYNFPQNRVTDHRIKTNFSLEVVMVGGMEKMLEDLIKWDVEEKLKNL